PARPTPASTKSPAMARRSLVMWMGMSSSRVGVGGEDLIGRAGPESSHGSWSVIMAAMDQVRIDKWLWAARFFKTRGAATEAVLGGRVQVNGGRVKPAKEIKAEDLLEIQVGQTRFTVVVRALGDKRGPAKVAATLYEETEESRLQRERHAAERKLAAPLGSDLG